MKILKGIGFFTLYAIAGGIVGALLANYSDNLLPSTSELGFGKSTLIGLIFASIIVGFFVSVLIHELGHLLFGVAAKMKPVAMMVGPCCWKFEEEKRWPKLTFQKGIVGGLTLCVPTEMTELKKPLVRFIVGGPLGSFALGAACIAFYSVSPMLLKIPLIFTALITILLGLYNLYPKTVAGMHTDGARLRTLFKNNAACDEMIAQFLLSAHMYAEGTPNDWPQDQIDTLVKATEDSPEWRAGQYFSYMKTKFSEDWASAKAHLALASQNLDDMPRVMKNSYLSSMATFSAVCDHDFEYAGKMLTETGRGFISEKHTEAIYKAIIHISDGNNHAAEEQLAKAEKTMKRALFRGTVSLAKQDIQRLRAYIATKQAAESSAKTSL